MRVLAGDIGGTKTLLAVVDVDDTRARIEIEHRYDSHAYPGLAPMVKAFMDETKTSCERSSFGVAGPVIENRAQATNLPWVIDADALRSELGLGPTRIVNDFVAVAYGVLRLGPDDVTVLNPGTRAPTAPIAVLGAGTGLGEGFLCWNGRAYDVVPSEGGHADFAPRDDVQIGLLQYLRRTMPHVSYERVVSGLGLRNIYAYLRDSNFARESPAVREAMDRGEDPGAVIGHHALAGTDRLCEATIDIFVSAYGAEAGNLALKVVARGGVFLAGGVAPKLLPKLVDGKFRAAYIDKGRFTPLVETIPCYAITHPRVGLLGAAVASLY